MHSPNITFVSIRKRERHFKKLQDKIFENFKSHKKIPFVGESVGYTVKSMEKDFPISNYPLEQTEFLYDSKQGRGSRRSK